MGMGVADASRHGMESHGIAWHGMESHGMAWHGMESHGTAQACPGMKKRAGPMPCAFHLMHVLVADDLAGLQARGADVLALRRLAHERANPLNIRIPATLGASVRVRDAVPEAGALAADIAVGSHGALLHMLSRSGHAACQALMTVRPRCLGGCVAGPGTGKEYAAGVRQRAKAIRARCSCPNPGSDRRKAPRMEPAQ